jgi:hypothetical protein
MNTLADRRFQHMLGLSVLLHGALFVALPRPSVTPPAMPQLVASIRLVMPEVSMPALPAPAAQPAPVQKPFKRPPPRRVRPGPSGPKPGRCWPRRSPRGRPCARRWRRARRRRPNLSPCP